MQYSKKKINIYDSRKQEITKTTGDQLDLEQLAEEERLTDLRALVKDLKCCSNFKFEILEWENSKMTGE